MSRIANKPISVPKDVEVKVSGQKLLFKGPKGTGELAFDDKLEAVTADDKLYIKVKSNDKVTNALSGTLRALANNLVTGVKSGHERKLVIIGIGYKAQGQGNKLNLNLGYSHPITFDVPKGVTVTVPTPTEIILNGIDKRQVGEVAAKIRSFRPPEPYKGKGITYSNERVYRKEAKKK